MNKFMLLTVGSFFISSVYSMDSEFPYGRSGAYTQSYQREQRGYDDHLFGGHELFTAQPFFLMAIIYRVVNGPAQLDDLPTKKKPRIKKKDQPIPTRSKHEHPHPKSTYRKH